MVTDIEGHSGKADYWREQVDLWRSSGLSQAEYCRRAGISASSLCYWKRRLGVEPPASWVPAIVPVPLSCASAEESEPRPLVLHMGSGFRIEVGGDFRTSVLKKLIRTVAEL
jgi:hypothetical protein